MLRSYVEAGAIGRFFGALRTTWSLALILYFFGARYWLDHHPGDFGPLFGTAAACGTLRLLLIARLPERSERTSAGIRIREAFALVKQSQDLRRYLLGAASCSAVRSCVLPFAIVMMRREVGFGEADVIYTTIAYFTGSAASLYLWGLAVDRVGAAPIFRGSALAMAALLLCVLLVREPSDAALLAMIAFFFVFSILSSGFGVADTNVLFSLAPADAPARTLVLAQTIVFLASGAAPLLVGAALQIALNSAGSGESRISVYHGFFTAAAVVQALSYLPLRRFTRRSETTLELP